MKRKSGNELWFWFYEFLMKTIYAETYLYKIAKGATWDYSRKLTPPQAFVFELCKELYELVQIVGAGVQEEVKFYKFLVFSITTLRILFVLYTMKEDSRSRTC